MKYKNILLTALISALLVGTASSFVAYRAGMQRSLGLQKGTLLGTTDALRKLRSGDIEGGTRRIETMCFLSAVLLLDDPQYAANPTVRMMIPEVVAYRHTYRTNRSDWTTAEERLELLLSQKQ